jgi:hypothetical protein
MAEPSSQPAPGTGITAGGARPAKRAAPEAVFSANGTSLPLASLTMIAFMTAVLARSNID